MTAYKCMYLIINGPNRHVVSFLHTSDCYAEPKFTSIFQSFSQKEKVIWKYETLYLHLICILCKITSNFTV